MKKLILVALLIIACSTADTVTKLCTGYSNDQACFNTKIDGCIEYAAKESAKCTKCIVGMKPN